jgi:hypothetical protein
MTPHDYVGLVIKSGEGRSIKVEAAFAFPLESFFLMRWMDTDQVFCEFSEKIIYLIGDCNE